ncbi:MAG: hypothetical protein Q9227_005819 [Pyrenula ochraceoflavens]
MHHPSPLLPRWEATPHPLHWGFTVPFPPAPVPLIDRFSSLHQERSYLLSVLAAEEDHAARLLRALENTRAKLRDVERRRGREQVAVRSSEGIRNHREEEESDDADKNSDAMVESLSKALSGINRKLKRCYKTQKAMTINLAAVTQRMQEQEQHLQWRRANEVWNHQQQNQYNLHRLNELQISMQNVSLVSPPSYIPMMPMTLQQQIPPYPTTPYLQPHAPGLQSPTTSFSLGSPMSAVFSPRNLYPNFGADPVLPMPMPDVANPALVPDWEAQEQQDPTAYYGDGHFNSVTQTTDQPNLALYEPYASPTSPASPSSLSITENLPESFYSQAPFSAPATKYAPTSMLAQYDDEVLLPPQPPRRTMSLPLPNPTGHDDRRQKQNSWAVGGLAGIGECEPEPDDVGYEGQNLRQHVNGGKAVGMELGRRLSLVGGAGAGLRLGRKGSVDG